MVLWLGDGHRLSQFDFCYCDQKKKKRETKWKKGRKEGFVETYSSRLQSNIAEMSRQWELKIPIQFRSTVNGRKKQIHACLLVCSVSPSMYSSGTPAYRMHTHTGMGLPILITLAKVIPNLYLHRPTQCRQSLAETPFPSYSRLSQVDDSHHPNGTGVLRLGDTLYQLR